MLERPGSLLLRLPVGVSPGGGWLSAGFQMDFVEGYLEGAIRHPSKDLVGTNWLLLVSPSLRLSSVCLRGCLCHTPPLQPFFPTGWPWCGGGSW